MFGYKKKKKEKKKRIVQTDLTHTESFSYISRQHYNFANYRDIVEEELQGSNQIASTLRNIFTLLQICNTKFLRFFLYGKIKKTGKHILYLEKKKNLFIT